MVERASAGDDIGAAKIVLGWTSGRPGTLAQLIAGEPMAVTLSEML